MVSELKQSREHHLILGDLSPDWLDIKSCFSVRRWAGQGLGWSIVPNLYQGDKLCVLPSRSPHILLLAARWIQIQKDTMSKLVR